MSESMRFAYADPVRFCWWVLDLLNFQEGDEIVDIFPGTGVMGEVAAQDRPR